MPAASKKRTRKPRAAAQHPKYADMIIAALSGMKERGGTSRQKIVKFIGSNYKVGNGFGVQVRLAIKRMLKAKKRIQVKGTGASGSFRLSTKATKPGGGPWKGAPESLKGLPRKGQAQPPKRGRLGKAAQERKGGRCPGRGLQYFKQVKITLRLRSPHYIRLQVYLSNASEYHVRQNP